MWVRMRVTIKTKDDRGDGIRIASDVRKDLWSHSLVKVDPEHPLRGIHWDKDGHAYFEFATESPDDVRRVIEKSESTDELEVNDTPELPGEECVNCGNVAGPLPPSVCPSCGFRDITPCPLCEKEVSRESYIRISSDLFLCPNCKNRMRLRYNEPMVLLDGNFNQPLVLVEEAITVHGI